MSSRPDHEQVDARGSEPRGRLLEFARLANRGDRWRYRTTELTPHVDTFASDGGAHRPRS